MGTDGTTSGWRARWVRRENERRRTAYEAAVTAWRWHDDQLRQFYAEAEQPPQWIDSPPGLPVPLDEGEVVIGVQPSAELVEVTARHATGLPAPELTVVPVEQTDRSPRLPKGLAVVDAGTAVVTDRRVILAGRDGQQEWPYEQLAGVAHDPDEPFTLLHAHRPGSLRGVRVPRSAASAFRLHLTLAYAEAVGARDALLDGLDEALMAHAQRRPPVPEAATPADAPAAARLARPALVAAVAVLVALAAVAGTVRWSTGEQPVVGMRVDHDAGAGPTGEAAPTPSTGLGAPDASTTPTPAPGSAGATVPGSTPGAGVTAPGSGPAVAPNRTTGGWGFTPSLPPVPTTGGTRPSPTTSPSPSPSPQGLCGAPDNPWGYNYCGGDNYVDNPDPDVCSYFTCVDPFPDGNGYLVLCNDGLLSITGTGSRPCADHNGVAHPVYERA